MNPCRNFRAVTVSFLLLVTLGCAPSKPIRFATFNASLNRDAAGKLIQDLYTPDNPQAKNVAEVIQRVNPDVLLINEFDYDQRGQALLDFQKNYLEVGQNGAQPIKFAYHYFASVNTGIASGKDLDNDGKVVMQPGSRGYGGDALGFGLFPGQYGMVLLSKFPIDERGVRTFQRFRWKDMPNAMPPTDQNGKPWYSDDELKIFRLSSKSHWDVPIKIGKRTMHVLVSHPTPPAFDGPEDRNGKRNHDEIRFWADYLNIGPDMHPYIVDDAGERGGIERTPLPAKRGLMVGSPMHGWPSFVIMGDMNADPNDGGSVPGAIQQLLDNHVVNGNVAPTSEGATEAARVEGANNAAHKTPAKFDTADFADTGDGPGNLRCDYVLPSRDLKVVNSGVFWPASSDELSRLVKMDPTPATSDHRLVWVDVRF